MQRAMHTPSLQTLAQAFLCLDTTESIQNFLQDLCTPTELAAMADRWRVVPLLARGLPYRTIHAQTGVSVTTIGRVARTVEYGAGGYALALKHWNSEHPSHNKGTSLP